MKDTTGHSRAKKVESIYMWRNSKVVTGSRYIELIVLASNHPAEYLKSVERGKGHYKSWFEGKS